MSKVRLDIGAEVDFLTKGELDDSLEKQDERRAKAAERERLSGVKYFRLPRLFATPASGTVVLGQAWSANGTSQVYTDQICGPNQGYVWSIRRISVTGLGTGNSPDLLNIYRNDITFDPVWQLNGNSFAYTFSRGELMLLPGEKLVASSLGSMTATTQVVLSGEAVEVPAELIGKLVA